MNFYARYRLMLFGHANVQRRRRRRCCCCCCRRRRRRRCCCCCRRRCCIKINCAKGRKEADNEKSGTVVLAIVALVATKNV